MAEKNTHEEGCYIVGGESNGKVILSEEGRRMLGIKKKKITSEKFWDLVFDKTYGQRK